MNQAHFDDLYFEEVDSNAKGDRAKKLAVQRRIYELKEKQRLKRELEDYDDFDYYYDI